MFLFILMVAIFLAYYNLEVLSGFLLVVEFTAFFVIVLFLLALNFEGKLDNRDSTWLKFSLPVAGLYLGGFYAFSKPASLDFLNASYYWDDYYADLNDDILNDIAGLYLSFYNFNGLLFFFFGLLLFFATLVCVTLFRIVRTKTQEHLISMQYVFTFFKDLVNFEFLRKQSMTSQTRHRPVTRLVRFKRKNVTKK